MEGYSEKPRSARPFVQAGYERDESGRLAAPVPARCPLGDDGSECRVGFRGCRERKTGPKLPLTVARCHCHGIAFTVYPPAFVPYGRAAVVAVDVEGRRIGAEPGASVAVAGTTWEAIADAAAGQRWAEAGGGGKGSRRTQGRRLTVGASLFGLFADSRARERVAAVLKLPALMLHEAAQRHVGLDRWRERAELVWQLLRQPLAGARSYVLLAAGHVAGLWGRPLARGTVRRRPQQSGSERLARAATGGLTGSCTLPRVCAETG